MTETRRRWTSRPLATAALCALATTAGAAPASASAGGPIRITVEQSCVQRSSGLFRDVVVFAKGLPRDVPGIASLVFADGFRIDSRIVADRNKARVAFSRNVLPGTGGTAEIRLAVGGERFSQTLTMIACGAP